MLMSKQERQFASEKMEGLCSGGTGKEVKGKRPKT